MCFYPHNIQGHQYTFGCRHTNYVIKGIWRRAVLITRLLIGYILFHTGGEKQYCTGIADFKSSNYPDADKSLNKVAGLFSHNLQSEWLEIDFSYWGSSEKERNNITALERAIINKWELQITSQLFDRELPKDFSITPVYKEEYNTPVFILHFSEKIAYKVYDEFQEKYIKKLDDGTLEVTFRYQLKDWTFLYLLSFGEYVEIIEPVEARNILKEKAKKIFSMY